MTAGQVSGAEHQRLDERTLAAAFSRAVPAEPAPISYRLLLTAVAFAMLLLPLLYLAVVAGTAWLTWLWAFHGAELLLTKPNFVKIILYLVPVVAGACAVVMLLRPLLARRPAPPPLRVVSPHEEPVLHAYAESIARAVGAPPPRRIQVDLEVNASASFRRGLASFVRRDDLVLTIGLPLVAGLSAEELACVLAHEFGHFSQAAGMRLSFLIRTENEWLARIAFERDRWDVVLERHASSGGLYERMFGNAARWLLAGERKLLAGLAWAGCAVSGRMSQAMEFGADRRAYLLAGASVFEAAHVRIRRLSVAQHRSLRSLHEATLSKRRLKDLPALVVAQLARSDDHEDAGDAAAPPSVWARWLATHPSDSDRLERARESGAAAALRIGAPASALFADFPRLCEEVSRAIYEDAAAEWPAIQADFALDQQAERTEERTAVRCYLQGGATLVRPFFPGFSEIASLAAVDAVRAELTAARDLVTRRAKDRIAAMKEIEEARQRGILADAAAEYLAADVTIQHASFGLSAANKDAVAQARAAVADDASSAARDVDEVETPCARRLRTALGLLDDPVVAGSIDGAGSLREETTRALAVLGALETAWPEIVGVVSLQELMSNLAAGSFASKFEKKVAPRVEGVAVRLQHELERLRRRLDAQFPFARRGATTIGEYAVDPFPDVPTGRLAATADGRATEAVLRLFLLHQRLLGRLCVAAQRVEAALGLPPLPDPDPPVPAAPASEAPRKSHF